MTFSCICGKVLLTFISGVFEVYMKKIDIKMSDISILVSAMLWGTVGIFSRKLFSLGFSTTQTVAVRAFFTVLVMLIYILITDAKAIKIKLRDVWMFIGTGICSFMFFNVCYMNSIAENSLSVACILMYTSPFWVCLLSFFFFKDKITVFGFLSLCVCFAGCVMVCGSSSIHITKMGLIYGILSGFGYALYSIFGKVASKCYPSKTVIFYTFLFALIGILPFCRAPELVTLLRDGEGMLYSFGMALVNTILPYILYTYGLSKTSAGKASVISIIEPVAASLVGLIAFKEKIGLIGICGMALVVIGLAFYEKSGKKKLTDRQL